MSRFRLNEQEIESIRTLLDEVVGRYDSPEDEAFLGEADVIAHELPRRLRKAMREFRLFEPEDAILIVSGYPVDDARIGRTPEHWRTKDPANDTRGEEMLLVLLGTLLGDPIGWSTQQDGRVVHDIFPIKGHENEQLGSGSKELLTWHVEDAFHPYRGDYLGMMCLRNPDRVPTTFAAVSSVGLTEDQLRVLSSPHFTIRPDESHLKKNRGNGKEDDDPILQRAYEKIERMMTSPEKIPVLFGDLHAPYIRLDPYFMDPPEDETARAVFAEVTRRFDEVIGDCVLEAGDFCFIDNYQAVHGRKPFEARFDGTDRWMKRINVVRDLRRSRDARRSAASRVIY
jgi:enduracididine beta-hydroxylase